MTWAKDNLKHSPGIMLETIRKSLLASRNKDLRK